ncbi:glycosyltransferase family 2 protein [Leptolyngbya sp. 7M]|uniref:glycosyltransferase family 2 protein n=1 Tax=Leptolyngbya sp. 7M TaxID=2812896 RepID=UPI001B8C6868|nr:glycosyltransferase family 2 protein [Leptolyngbya sp. 7M]QYO63800.1 glycosyltransferase [Leptolyngbya sp. 7M]
MSALKTVLEQISLVARNYGDGVVLEDVLLDWFEFLGGKPGEVVIVDAGSNPETQEIYWQLFKRGLIDKLQIIQQNHEEQDFDRGYIQTYTAAAIATKPYLLWFNIDTLPYRKGHEGWLEESIGYLEREDVFAVGGSFNMPAKLRDAWDGWYFSYKCSLNFALMKRSVFMAAVQEYAGDYVASGFTGENPAAITNQERYMLEIALERYMERHNVYTLFKIEDPNWTVFHTNTHEQRLKLVRQRYRARKNIEQYMNAAFSDALPDPSQAIYYGAPKDSLIKRLRVAVGRSQVGPYWRSLKQLLLQKG